MYENPVRAAFEPWIAPDPGRRPPRKTVPHETPHDIPLPPPDDPRGEAPASEREARGQLAGLGLKSALGALAAADRDGHLGLPELESLVARRGHSPDGSPLPPHLTRCAICLDLYEALVQGVAPMTAPTRARLLRLHAESGRARRWPASRWLALAASLAILATAGLQARHVAFPNPPVAVHDGCRGADGVALPAGSPMPVRRPVLVPSGATLALGDGGTSLRAERESRVSFARTLRGHPVFHVHGGDVWVSAAKQKPGMAVRVTTALGEIRVIGTEFRVTVESEPIVVHESRPDAPGTAAYEDRIAAVSVAVREGAVAVQGRRDRVVVSAGETAVLRQGQPRIEVR